MAANDRPLKVLDEVPWSETITAYDVAHLGVDLRLIDAEERRHERRRDSATDSWPQSGLGSWLGRVPMTLETIEPLSNTTMVGLSSVAS